MGIEEVERIKTLLTNSGAKFEFIEHEPVKTSEDAARIRNAPLKAGIKAIVVKTRDSQHFYVADIPADKKVDFKKLEKVIGCSSLTMATPQEV
ncbi:MAG: YbaK/EbsC family protein [Candidatus Micrarchaeota archaeon]|nr:YbaK/EbsC family protein [Candidatus Micrarchaeota archaeon]